VTIDIYEEYSIISGSITLMVSLFLS